MRNDAIDCPDIDYSGKQSIRNARISLENGKEIFLWEMEMVRTAGLEPARPMVGRF